MEPRSGCLQPGHPSEANPTTVRAEAKRLARVSQLGIGEIMDPGL